MQLFWYHHQTLYRRGLWLGLLAILALGLSSSIARSWAPELPKAKLSLAGADWSQLDPSAKSAASATVASADLLPPYGPGVSEAPAAPIALVAANTTGVIALGRAMNAQRFGDGYWDSLNALWSHESGWRPEAVNRHSGACGIPQALPCSKITDMSDTGQISWGLNYIAARYGNPANAWSFWLGHHWY